MAKYVYWLPASRLMESFSICLSASMSALSIKVLLISYLYAWLPFTVCVAD